MPHQVGHEEDGTLEHADQEQVTTLVVARDLDAELGHAGAQALPVDQDLAHRPFQLRLTHSRSRRRQSRHLRSRIPLPATAKPRPPLLGGFVEPTPPMSSVEPTLMSV